MTMYGNNSIIYLKQKYTFLELNATKPFMFHYYKLHNTKY